MTNNNNTAKTRVFSSSSSSSSSRSYTSSSSSSLPQTSTTRTMEQVWKDLSLFPPPKYHSPNPNTSHSSLRGVILQDFLSGPVKETLTDSSVASRMSSHGEFSLPLPPTVLTLNSAGHDFELLNPNSCSAGVVEDCRASRRRADPFAAPPGFSDATAGLLSFVPHDKRVLESSCSVRGDRKHKRMMKNRESAARSRARKQAFLSLIT